MRIKLIAIVVAGLFAQSAYADEDFVWGGSIDAGWRGTNIDGGLRNGGVGPPAASSSPALPTPFTGPSDEAKAQEYQDIRSAPIGVFDIRGGSRAYYLRAFAEELGRDDQYINIVGGGWGAWKASLYNNDIPHNYSFNALSPLTNVGSTLLGFSSPSGAYPPASNPATWGTWNYGTQRNTTGGNFEVSMKSPWFVRADYNEVKTNGIKPGSGQLGTGSGNGLIEFGVPADYKTQNVVIEGGYNSKRYGIKLAYIGSKFTDNNDSMQWPNFYMRNGLDTTLLPPDNDLKKWALSGYIRQLPWDSAIIARFTQSKLENSFGVTSTSLKPTGNTPTGQFIPPGVGYLVTQPDASNFNGDIKTTTANIAWNASPMAQLDTRVYYDYYDLQNRSTNVSYARGSQGSNCANPPANSATCFTIAALPAGEAFQYTKNSAGFDALWAFNRGNKLLGGFDWIGVDRDLAPAPHTDDYRYWIEYRNSGGWADLTGRLKYEYLQRRSDLDHAFTNNADNVQPTTVPYYFTAYDVSNFDRNMVKLNVDWTPMPLLLVSFGATWRETDYKDTYYGRTNDHSQQYDVTASWGDDRLRITGIGNWGKVKFEQDYRNVSSGASPLPGGPQTSTTFDWGTQNTQDGWMLAALLDWAATDKLMLTASYTYQKTGGGVDFTSGNTQAAGGFSGGPLVNYNTDNTTLNRFQIKGNYNINKNWGVSAGYAYEKYDYSDGQMAGYSSYYPYFQNLGGSNISWNTGAFANPGYTVNLVWLTATYMFNPPSRPAAPMRVAEAQPAPRVAPPPPAPPPPAPPAPAPQVQKITLDSKALFDFDKAILKAEGKTAIDSQIVGKLSQLQKLEVILVTGHTDRIGGDAYNQKLSERRADAVRDYLVSKGVPKDKIETIGMGEKQPLVQCDQKGLKELIACLQPNRRVEVDVKGEAKK
ncbi:MAG: MtrB/PioB family outer membrane beta-barrel protein [Casimicrobiaceae bacterium]